MAYHTGNMKPKAEPAKTKKMSGAAKLKEASKHHSKKHMDLMKKLMKEGKSFAEAHKIALKEVGK